MKSCGKCKAPSVCCSDHCSVGALQLPEGWKWVKIALDCRNFSVPVKAPKALRCKSFMSQLWSSEKLFWCFSLAVLLLQENEGSLLSGARDQSSLVYRQGKKQKQSKRLKQQPWFGIKHCCVPFKACTVLKGFLLQDELNCSFRSFKCSMANNCL